MSLLWYVLLLHQNCVKMQTFMRSVFEKMPISTNSPLNNICMHMKINVSPRLWIRIRFYGSGASCFLSADPDPAVFLNADSSDPVLQNCGEWSGFRREYECGSMWIRIHIPMLASTLCGGVAALVSQSTAMPHSPGTRGQVSAIADILKIWRTVILPLYYLGWSKATIQRRHR